MTRTTTTTTIDSNPARDGTRLQTHDVVRVATACDGATVSAWAQYVERSPAGSVFHHPDWCQTVEAVFGHQPRHCIAWRDGRVVGVLPLIEVNSLFGGRMLVSVPYGTYGGVLGDDAGVHAALGAEATRLAEQCGARVVDLRSAEASVPGFEPVEGYLGFARELPDHPNDVPGFLPKRARAAARHARERDGFVIEHDARQLRTVWQLYCRSMRRIGSINYPYSLFEQLAERLGNRQWVSVARREGRVVVGTISLVFRDTIMPYVLGADERVSSGGAANLLYWSVMERAVRSGLRRFDYGRSRADNSGAVGFKKNQGFTPRPLGYQRYVPAGRKPPDLKPSNPRFALARRVWTRLPLPLSRALGAWLARSIPG